jgi:hypothetical protein
MKDGHAPTLVKLDAEMMEEVVASEQPYEDGAEACAKLDVPTSDRSVEGLSGLVMVPEPSSCVDAPLLTCGDIDPKRRRPILWKTRCVGSAVRDGIERKRLGTIDRVQNHRDRRLDSPIRDDGRVWEGRAARRSS